MNPSKLFTYLVVASLGSLMVAADDTPAVAPVPGNGPIYYGRPNNGGYPYTTAPPASNNGPIYNGRPNNGGYPYTTAPPHDTPCSQSSSSNNASGNATDAPSAGGYTYNGRPNNGGYPYTTAPPKAADN